MTVAEAQSGSRVIATVAVDLAVSPIGTRSRLGDVFAGRPVLHHTLGRLASVKDLQAIVLLVTAGQEEAVRELVAPLGESRIEIQTLVPRPAKYDWRTREARGWDLVAWRGGAGQCTVFDEDFHAASVLAAAETHGAEHVLSIPAHAALLDVDLVNRLVQHHLYKNHEMRATYTPAAPGIGGIIIQTVMLRELAAAHAVPGQSLQYDPRSPTMDTLIREACVQVDPALSKIQNRFLLDNDRSWALAEKLRPRMPFACSADMALAAREVGTFAFPREIEIELTGKRFCNPPGSVPAAIREARMELDPAKWVAWLKNQTWADDVLLTLCGDGDPLAYARIVEVCAAAREAGIRHIHVQTDLLEHADRLFALVERQLVDVVSVMHYGHTAETYARVAGVDGQSRAMANMQLLAQKIGQNETGLPIVLCRLLKVRETIPEMEAFFDTWCVRCGWAVIDAPTDRAGAVPFAAVLDMAPPKRRACRRIGDRMLIRANGVAVTCDQDVHDTLALGNIAGATLPEIWQGDAMCKLKEAHAMGNWMDVDPCRNCREWHRA